MDRIDWNKAWADMNEASGNDNSSEFWDDFAPKFRKKINSIKEDPYIEQFYKLAEIQPGDSLFDMGCGSGTLAIPYAKMGHEVYAADFSQVMLDYLMDGAREEGVENKIHPIKLDWNEDWSKRELPVCDVAFSSRALIFKDLTSSLQKLESVASRRCCIGAWDNPASGYDRYVAKAIGYERPGYGCHYYIMNELMDRDVFPEMLYIKSSFRLHKYDSFEEGLEKIRSSFARGLTPEQDRLLEEYCQKHMTLNEAENGGFWRLDHSDLSTIALIRWDKRTIYSE